MSGAAPDLRDEQQHRQRLGQILHDHLQQDVVAAKFQLLKLSARADPQDAAAWSQALALIDQVIATGRTLYTQLNPPAASPELPAPTALSLLLVDDHVLIRQALAKLLNAEADLRVIGEASDGLEAIEMAQRLQPEVVLMALELPELDGPATTRLLRVRWPGLRVIGLAMRTDEHHRGAMLAAGAEAVLSTTEVSEVLLEQLRGLRSQPPATNKSSGGSSRLCRCSTDSAAASV